MDDGVLVQVLESAGNVETNVEFHVVGKGLRRALLEELREAFTAELHDENGQLCITQDDGVDVSYDTFVS